MPVLYCRHLGFSSVAVTIQTTINRATTMRKSQRHREPPIDAAVAPPSSSQTGFSFTLTRMAVAQICQSVGFKAAQNPALEILTNIATVYLKSIAKSAVTSANAHGRTESNLPDIIVALEDLSSVQGFPGASNVRSRSLYASGAVKDLMKFVKYTDEIPFAQPLPMGNNFVRGPKRKSLKRNRWYGNGGNLNHVPRWLPDLPAAVEVEVEVGEKRRERERIWGCLDGGEDVREEGNGSEMVVEKEGKDSEIALLGKREKVKFKIGVTIGNLSGSGGGGVCRGGGIGKRVLCKNWMNEEENQVKRVGMKMC